MTFQIFITDFDRDTELELAQELALDISVEEAQEQLKNLPYETTLIEDRKDAETYADILKSLGAKVQISSSEFVEDSITNSRRNGRTARLNEWRILNRAMEESVPVILEGVHAHPDLMEILPPDSDSIVVHATLAVLKAKELKGRLRGRGAKVPQRRSKRYLNKFESVWSLQSYLLSEADRCNVPIITNNDKEKATQQIIQHVVHELSKQFKGTARDIFGEVVDDVEDLAEVQPWHQLVVALSD